MHRLFVGSKLNYSLTLQKIEDSWCRSGMGRELFSRRKSECGDVQSLVFVEHTAQNALGGQFKLSK